MPSSTFANSGRHQHWDVQEGSAQDLAPDLENSEGQALVFVSHSQGTTNGQKLSSKPLSERPNSSTS